MVSKAQNLNLVGINKFICAFQSFNVKKDDISSELLKVNYSNVALNRTHERHSTPTNNEDKVNNDKQNLGLLNNNHRV